MDPTYAAGLVWLRRDLRLADNAGLYHALKTCRQVHCAFLFDTAILAKLPRQDRRVEFIHDAVLALDERLRALAGAGLLVLHGAAVEEIPALAARLGVQAVFANHDDEPLAVERDLAVRNALGALGIALHTSKDQVLFEREEVLTQAGKPYSVFTPYSRAWLARLDDFYVKPYPVERYAERLAKGQRPIPTLADLGFAPTNLHELPLGRGEAGAQALLDDFLPRLDRYDALRDLPAVKGPSYLGVHLRFGTVSIRQLARLARERSSSGAATWLKELAWRDFYFQVLANFPQVGRGDSFKPEYDRIAWAEGPLADEHFAAWCEGRTGYPLVDAAMLQLNRTGYMHNRLRMVTASFLCKDLGIDWRRGERYFAEKLNDYDFAANNGGWQWASSSGCDAQPYFRIFNPVSQSRRFDAEGKFIVRYLPQLAKLPPAAIHAPWEAGGRVDYPPPIVDHAVAREETLRRYAVVKG
ncbi:MAG: cryptochrome/photolyase family protein [Ramlibacter sp.]